MNDLPKIIVHGSLGKELGRQEWEIDIRSGSEALHAINCLTGDGIKKYFRISLRFLEKNNSKKTYAN